MIANIGLPSRLWDPVQRREAKNIWGDILDIQYPEIPAEASEQAVGAIADDLVDSVKNAGDITAVVVKGELSLMIAVVDRLRSSGYDVYAASSERTVLKKRTRHSFVRFRKL